MTEFKTLVPKHEIVADSPEDAAVAFFKLLQETQGAATAKLYSPEQAGQMVFGPSWVVSWEDGPHDWGASVSIGGDPFIDCADRSDNQFCTTSGDNWHMEVHYGFDIMFFDNEPG